MQREDVWFNSGSDRISAWLYRPASDRDSPLLVMAHGLGAVRTMRLDSYAERFCEAGYACLVFDYRNFGDSEGAPRQLLDIRMQLQDWTVAVAYARTLAGIDPNRIGLWGTSFSGGHVIATAARLPGIAAVVSQCPFCVCETDTVAPSGPTRRYAATAPRGEIKLYPEGHFEIYVGDAFERVLADQLEFLERNLLKA
ncbi:alpha/beta hydrolase [Mycobacterium sp.]|uniref:alpha/beta hydrolase n=1 Tax=Mycobacterium sp. TaxID=1785 RepID=UPI003C7628B4